MTAATDRLPRLLSLVPYLLARPGIRLADVAADFGVSVEQVRDDLNLLWVCGLPGYGPGDLIDLAWAEDDTVTVTHDAGIRRPLRLSTNEALALIVALRTLADVPGLEGGDAIDRALAKLEHAAGTAATGTSRLTVRVEAEEATLAGVRRAVDEGRALRITYYTAGRDETTERTVDPTRLLLVEGRSYLEGWCRRAEAIRLFRLDRIDALTLLDEPAAVPPQAQPVDVGGGVFRPSPEHELVVLLLAPQARWVADFYPTESIVESADGSLEVSLRAADRSWVSRLVLGLGAAVTVVAPQNLAEDVRAMARAALAAYEESVL
ncbi:MAG: YafY family transcriptional regulator [Actinomycetota bacterium]|nr:YafY family transcriptional regulator [Actinomycetota bacterium]